MELTLQNIGIIAVLFVISIPVVDFICEMLKYIAEDIFEYIQKKF